MTELTVQKCWVAAVIRDNDANVLVARWADTQAWDLPAGVLRLGEDVCTGVRKVVSERRPKEPARRRFHRFRPVPSVVTFDDQSSLTPRSGMPGVEQRSCPQAITGGGGVGGGRRRGGAGSAVEAVLQSNAADAVQDAEPDPGFAPHHRIVESRPGTG